MSVQRNGARYYVALSRRGGLNSVSATRNKGHRACNPFGQIAVVFTLSYIVLQAYVLNL